MVMNYRIISDKSMPDPGVRVHGQRTGNGLYTTSP